MCKLQLKQSTSGLHMDLISNGLVWFLKFNFKPKQLAYFFLLSFWNNAKPKYEI